MKIMTWKKYDTCLLFSLVQGSLLRDTTCLTFLATEIITCYHIKWQREKQHTTISWSRCLHALTKQETKPNTKQSTGQQALLQAWQLVLSQDTWSFCSCRNSPAHLGAEFGNMPILHCKGASTYRHAHKQRDHPAADPSNSTGNSLDSVEQLHEEMHRNINLNFSLQVSTAAPLLIVTTSWLL